MMKMRLVMALLLFGVACTLVPTLTMAGTPVYNCGVNQVWGICTSSSYGCPKFANVVICTGGDCEGTDGDDCIIGTNGDDVIYAGGGDDQVCAYAGNDVVYAGFGRDYVCGGFGNDEIHGGWGRDELNGENGVDVIQGGQCDDNILGGGQDNDACKGGLGYDSIDGCDIADFGKQDSQTGGKCLD